MIDSGFDSLSMTESKLDQCGATDTGVDNVLAVLPDNLAASAMEARLLEDWTTQKDLNSDRR